MTYNCCNYLKGVGWFLLALISSVANDTITKKIGLQAISAAQISFLRFTWATIILIPCVLFYGASSFKSKLIKIHIFRGILLFTAIAIFTYSLTMVQMTSVTIVSLSIPLITLVLARIILNENVKWYRWIATLLGIIGVIIALHPIEINMSIYLYMLFMSAFMFSLLDIVNKKIIHAENMLSMLFYQSLFTAISAAPFAYLNWTPLHINELMLTCILGCGANLILYFLLKAFSLVESSALAPYRYIELIFSALAGSLFFNETINHFMWIGGAISVLSITFIFYTENNIYQPRQ